MGPDQQRLTSIERANLVAYLDGELSDAESRALATTLTHSLSARRELESLKRTWELLDHLPRPTAPENFTERTLVEVQKLIAEGGQWESAFLRSAGLAARAALWVLIWSVCFVVGMALTRWAWPNPTDRLARNLSIAEHLDEYRAVGDYQFLQELANSPEFGTDRED
jgi:anti-sigma factor RsiW